MANLAHLQLEAMYCSNGDTSGRRTPKKYFVSSKGSWLIDDDDRKYIDLQMCNSSANFGYGSECHLAALNSQMQTLPSLSSEFVHESRILLAQSICTAIETRWDVTGRVHFSVGGAQAVDDALKLIGQITGTTRVFAFEGSYHGRTIAASAISGAYRYRAGFNGSALANFVPFPYCELCPYDHRFPSCNYQCVTQFARLFDGEGAGQNDGGGHPECRAFIAEPVLGRGGYLAPPPDYFRRLRAVLDAHGILFVSDEVQMGFFRTGRLWSIEHYGVVPDIIIFGKALTNGMFPLSGLWARTALMAPDTWPPGSSHATFAGAPLGTALGLATMRLCDAENWADRADKIGAAVESLCQHLKAKHRVIHRVNRIGAALSLDLRTPSGRPAPLLARSVVETALSGDCKAGGEAAGAVLTAGGGHGNMIMIAPALTIDDTALTILEPLLDDVFTKVTTNSKIG